MFCGSTHSSVHAPKHQLQPAKGLEPGSSPLAGCIVKHLHDACDPAGPAASASASHSKDQASLPEQHVSSVPW